jgi:hypothetical protein
MLRPLEFEPFALPPAPEADIDADWQLRLPSLTEYMRDATEFVFEPLPPGRETLTCDWLRRAIHEFEHNTGESPNLLIYTAQDWRGHAGLDAGWTV